MFGHALERDKGYIEQRVLKMEQPGRREIRRPQRKVMGVAKEEIKMGGVKGEEAGDSVRWRPKIRCGESSREKLKEEEEEVTHHDKQITQMCPLTIIIVLPSN